MSTRPRATPWFREPGERYAAALAELARDPEPGYMIERILGCECGRWSVVAGCGGCASSPAWVVCAGSWGIATKERIIEDLAAVVDMFVRGDRVS